MLYNCLKSGERGLCWRHKFVNFQHLDDIKALGLDNIMKDEFRAEKRPEHTTFRNKNDGKSLNRREYEGATDGVQESRERGDAEAKYNKVFQGRERSNGSNVAGKSSKMRTENPTIGFGHEGHW